jgi:uncharacterized protein (TIGR02145 family)
MIRKPFFLFVLVIIIACISQIHAQLLGGQIKSGKNWSSMYPSGSVFCASGPTIVNDVTNPTTGKTWMDRNLGASQVATSSTDANAYGDLYQWGRRADGHQCRTSATISTLSSSDQPAHGNFILAPNSPNDWRSPQNTNLWQGVYGVNNPCPFGYRLPNDTELSNERLSWSTIDEIGAFNSILKIVNPSGRGVDGGVGFGNAISAGGYWSSTINFNNSNALTFAAGITSKNRGIGYGIRCIKETVGSIMSLNCGSSTVTGNLISGTAASGVTASIPYTGGNGGFFASQSISSTGVLGLTASISQGLFASGAGNLIYTISGMPSASGTASFVISIGGQSCTLSIVVYGVQPAYPTGSVFCNGITTIVNDVTNPTTGKTWMDRNLGATQVATSSTDAAAYGDLYQWGRGSDGHQCINSSVTSTLSSIDQPILGWFILNSSVPYDWRVPQNTNLWQGVNGTNNPCPLGYRIPTEVELNSERLSWSQNNSFGAITSSLRWPLAGRRLHAGGTLSNFGQEAGYWSSTVNNTNSRTLEFGNTVSSAMYNDLRARGHSVRCLKN